MGSIVYSRGQMKPTSDFCYVDIGSIDNKNQKLENTENIITPDKVPSRARKTIDIGDIIYSTVRPYLHNMCIIDKQFSLQPIASTGFATMTCYSGIFNKYLFYYLLAPDFDNYANDTENSKGVAYPAINDDRLYKALIPVAPLAEQKRIVAKIEELLPFIEKYEQAETKLTALNKSFPEMLKKSILQEAVQGKLVPQNPDDEPASILLERIRAEKQELIKQGKIKKSKHESIIVTRDKIPYEIIDGKERCIADEVPFEIPESWEWCRVGSIFTLQAGKNISANQIVEDLVEGLYPCFGGNCIRGGGGMWSFSSCQVQGRGHIKNHVPCQDKTKTIFENGTYVIALADGAGSAKLSHYGASCVVESIGDLFIHHFEDLYANEDGRQVKLAIMEKVLIDINSKAEELSCVPKDLAATMLVVAENNDRFIIAHIGDGVIGYLDGDVLKTASASSNGEHANETYFVTSRDAINTMKLFKGSIKNIAGFVIISDGTEQSLYNKKSNTISPAIIKLMQRNIILDKDAMCEQLDSTFKNVIITRTHDDCSIALLSRESGVLHSLSEFDFAEKCNLYDIMSCDRRAIKRIARYDLILDLLQKPSTYKTISDKIHLNPKYTKRHLRKMCAMGLVKCTNGVYQLSRFAPSSNFNQKR